MSSIAEALKRAATRLAATGIESARLDARVLLAHVLGLSSNEVALSRQELTAEQQDAFEALVARRAAKEPVAYIVGIKEFHGLEFEVGPGVLVPRPDSETLVEQAMREFPDRNAALRVLDLGTGTGCLLLSFLAAYPNATGLGIDRSAAALEWANRNVRRLRLERRAQLARLDWSELPPRAYDVVFANPPYVASADLNAGDDLNHEPQAALDGGSDGLSAYRSIAPLLPTLLSPGGKAFLEIGAGQGPSIAKVLEAHDLKVLRIAEDLAGIPRCVVAAR
ncbi:MAG TPA: peptide chain release factor N(5)-glutamine methyltransferase [Rhizomicrobium sp.]|jgi:release factor glutamine methyltransferase